MSDDNVVHIFEGGWMPVTTVHGEAIKVFEDTRRVRELPSGSVVSLCLGQCGHVPIELCALSDDKYKRTFMRAHGADVIARQNNQTRLNEYLEHLKQE